MTRSYGRVWFVPTGVNSFPNRTPEWHIKAEPHLILRMKRVFGRISKKSHGEVQLTHIDETCRDIEWFMGRYTLDISPEDLLILQAGARSHRETLLRLEQIADLNYVPRTFELAIPARDYQKRAAEIYLERGFLLLGDDVGIGKTATAICSFTDPRTLPACVVTLAGTLPRQWEDEVKRFAPALTTHVLKKGTPYELPRIAGRGPDVVILNYHKLDGWAEVLAAYCKSVVFDEGQELRRGDSGKYSGALHVARAMKFCLSMSATPIYNYGGEIFNVIDVLKEGVLGDRSEFDSEWCTDVRYGGKGSITDAKAFGTYLREHFIMLRRTRKEVGRELPPLQRIPHKISSDREALDKVRGSAIELARLILRQTEQTQKGEIFRASEELSNVLRMATGIAKAPYVADFIRLLVDSGERVLVYAWHREVYSILLERLADLSPVMFTGTETTAQKQAAKDKFTAGETQVMLMSLRAGAGVDGLQKCCRTVVFAELDWAAGVHEQCVGRIFRDGQQEPVAAYFLVAEDGADPVIAEVLGLKREQLEGIRNPEAQLVEEFASSGADTKKLAQFYLKKLGLPIPQEARVQ